MIVKAAAGGTADEVVGARLPLRGSLSGLARATNTPMICTDSEYDERVNRQACRDYGTRSFVIVPLRRAETVHGILKVASAHAHHFDEHAVATLTLLAAPFATALVNALSLEASHRQAWLDPVTGLGNRAHALSRLNQAMQHLPSHRSNGPQAGYTALVFLDLDRFKQVNDTHGHALGDRLLANVATAITGVTRAGDTTARYGGDEFVVICEGLALAEDADALAQRLITAIAGTYTLSQHASPSGAARSHSTDLSTGQDEADEAAVAPRDEPRDEPGQEVDVEVEVEVEVEIGVSVGVAVTATHHSPADFLHAADQAMYRAKRRGGDSYIVHDLDRP